MNQSSTPHKILIVEDEEVLREVLSESLEDEYGLSCHAVENGELALSYVKDHHVDFIVTDLKMPKMNGIDLVKELRKIDKTKPPILIVTGYSDLANDESAKQLGAVGLRNKPYDIGDIYHIIQKHLSA